MRYGRVALMTQNDILKLSRGVIDMDDCDVESDTSVREIQDNVHGLITVSMS